jgi:hypothetical protein
VGYFAAIPRVTKCREGISSPQINLIYVPTYRYAAVKGRSEFLNFI